MRVSPYSSFSYSTFWRNFSIIFYLHLIISLCVIAIPVSEAANIVVGDDPTKFNFRWKDGACYLPIKSVRVGDTIEFIFRGHDVYKMKSVEAYDTCNFSPDNAEMLATYGESPYKYTITKEDAQPLPNEEGKDSPSHRSLYFSCSIGAHCLGKQRVRIDVDINYSASLGTRSFQSSPREEDPVSKFVLGADKDSCARVQNGESESILDRFMESSCSEPKRHAGDYGRENWLSSCLSPPLTLTPGGVVNQATIMHYPFPEDHRVIIGRRTWEFVQGDINDLQLVNVNQLYVHHILGGIVMGNGAESIRRPDEDASFPRPYGRLSGDFDDVMTFHLIDLRETGDGWLPCAECRCKDTEGSYLGIGGSGGDGLDNGKVTGGISCCTNCTALTTPTIDYRMRYNVSWSEVEEDEPVQPIVTMIGDIALSIGKVVEWDVPEYKYLPTNQRLPKDPTVQVLEHIGPLNKVFGTVDYDDSYKEFEVIEIHRCAGHMHIGGLEAWVVNAETEELICNAKVTYGKNPTEDKGFITSISVQNYDPPIVIAADTTVKIITHYNASIAHTGVMGLFTLFAANHETSVVHPKETALTIDLCEPACDRSLLPNTDGIPVSVCKDNIKTMYPCIAMNVCDCETFMDMSEVGGCGGDWVTGAGSFPVNAFCAEHCGCQEIEDDEAIKKILIDGVRDRFTQSYGKLCRYATDDCKKYVSNLYACAKEVNMDELHPAVWDALDFQDGTRMALERAKLGSDAMHRFDKNNVNEKVLPCLEINTLSSLSANGIITDISTKNDDSSSANGLVIFSTFSIIFTLSFTSFAFLF